MRGETLRGVVNIAVYGDWEYSLQEIMDWVNAKLNADLPDGWGNGMGGINYAKAELIAAALPDPDK